MRHGFARRVDARACTRAVPQHLREGEREICGPAGSFGLSAVDRPNVKVRYAFTPQFDYKNALIENARFQHFFASRIDAFRATIETRREFLFQRTRTTIGRVCRIACLGLRTGLARVSVCNGRQLGVSGNSAAVRIGVC